MPIVKTQPWEHWASGISTQPGSQPFVSIAHAENCWDLLVYCKESNRALLHLTAQMASPTQNEWVWRAIEYPHTFSPAFLLAAIR